MIRGAAQSALEVYDYLNSLPVEDCDVLEFWKVNCLKYPVMNKIARDIFGAGLSSTEAEEKFSIAGIVIRDIRNRLGPLVAHASL